MRSNRRRVFSAVKTTENVLELLVYQQIGARYDGSGVTAKLVKEKINAAGKLDRVHVRINSPGGDAFEGIAILNVLRSLGKAILISVDGIAASAAAVIAMAGDRVEMGEGSMLMVHNASTFAIGDSSDLRKTADMLDKVSASIGETFTARTGKTAEEIAALMDAETWMSADEAVAGGFADAVISRAPEEKKSALALAGRFDLSGFRNAPPVLKNENAETGCECPCSECVEGDCEACSDPECDCEGCDCPGHENAAAAASNLSLFVARAKMLLRS